MKKLSFYLIFPVLFAVTISSCKKDVLKENPANVESLVIPTIQNDRLAFPSHEDYYNYISTLENKSQEDIEKIISQVGNFNSLAKEYLSNEMNDSKAFDLPLSFSNVLNKNGEVQIGNQIIWYHNGNKYFFPYTSENELSKFELEPEKFQHLKAGYIYPLSNNSDGITGSENNASSSSSGSPSTKKVISFTNGDAQNQYQFDLQGTINKYVHEIIPVLDGYYGAGSAVLWHEYLYLNVKMEYKSGSSWKTSSLDRQYKVNVSGSAVVSTPGQGAYLNGPYFQINETQVSHMVGIKTYLLAAFQGSGTLYNPTWTVNMTGTIYQNFTNALGSYPWYNTGTLW